MFKDTTKTEQTTTNTIIGSSVSVEGEFKGQGDVVIEGSLKGSLHTKHNVTIGENAKVQATISAANIHVAGQVTGNITATEHLELTKTSKVTGDLTVKTIAIEHGAEFNGTCNTTTQAVSSVEQQTSQE